MIIPSPSEVRSINFRQSSVSSNKVLFVIDTLETGGAELSLLETVTRFKKIVPVICHLYAGETLKREFIKRNIKVYSVDIFEKYKFFTAYKCLAKIVVEEQPDLIVACLTRSELVSRMVGKRYRIPVIGTIISDLYGKDYNKSLSIYSKLSVKLFRTLNRSTIPLCKGFIANSSSAKTSNAAHLGIPEKKIIVIHRGRDKTKFTFRKRESKPGQPLRFLTIGRLIPVKDHVTLIRGFKSYTSSHPYAELHIAGEGPCRNLLTQLINETGLTTQVKLLGNRDDLHLLTDRYDCCIFSSLSEGFSGAIVEAIFAGLPVLASDIPANQEIIHHCETGYLFKPGAANSIANALQWFTENQQWAIDLSCNAYHRACDCLDLDKTAGDTEEYLLKMII